MTTTWASPVAAWLDDLRAEEARLASELGTVRRVLAAADGSGGPATVDDLVRSLAARVPGEVWSAAWMLAQLCDAGWRTSSCDPDNIVRSALSRGVAAGWLVRPERGRYRYAGAVTT